MLAPGFLFLNLQSSCVDLGAIGFPGCQLCVPPLVTLPFGGSPFLPEAQIPPACLSSVYAQAAFLTTGGLHLSRPVEVLYGR